MYVQNGLGAGLSAPIPIKKEAWLGAAIGAVGSLIGGALTNQANSNLNGTNRLWQSMENRRAEQFQREMWQKQNEYNTPSAQRQRLQEAGFNPWMSGSGSPQSLAVSAGEGKNGSAPASIPMQDIIGNAVRNGVGTYYQAASAQANIANQNVQTLKQAIDTYKEARMNGWSKESAMAIIEPFIKSNNSLSDSNRYLDAIDYEIENKRLLNQYQKSVNEIYPQMSRSQMDKIDQDITESVARIGKMASDRAVNDAEIDRLVAEKAKLIAEKNHLDADTKTINAIRNALADKMLYDANQSKYQSSMLLKEDSEASARFTQRKKARNWMRSDEGQNEALANEIIEDNSRANQINKIVRGQNKR